MQAGRQRGRRADRQTDTHICAHTHAHTHTYAHTHMHTHTHTHTCTHTCTCTHALPPPPRFQRPTETGRWPSCARRSACFSRTARQCGSCQTNATARPLPPWRKRCTASQNSCRRKSGGRLRHGGGRTSASVHCKQRMNSCKRSCCLWSASACMRGEAVRTTSTRRQRRE